MRNKIFYPTKKTGQIMVIVLLVLSILSIFVIVIVSNTRRDITEKVQNKQYQQYYSVTEKKMLQVQGAIGTEPLSASDPQLTSLLQAGSESCQIGANSVLECNFTESGTELEVGTQDSARLNITIQDTNQLNQFTVRQDKNLAINLLDANNNGYTGNVTVTYNSNITLVVAIDYVTLSAGEYRVVKEVKDSSNPELFTGETHCYPNPENNFALPVNTFTFTFNVATMVQNCAGIAAGTYKPVGLRFKPLAGNTDITLSGDANFPDQFRSITGTTNSLVNPNSPVTVLELNYPLVSSPLGILDYVLRTESLVSKP